MNAGKWIVLLLALASAACAGPPKVQILGDDYVLSPFPVCRGGAANSADCRFQSR